MTGHTHSAWRHQHRPTGCDGCREAYNTRARERRERRRDRRVLIDGRLVATREGLAHGSSSTYDNWGCRCAPCSTVKAAERAAAKVRVTRALGRAA